MGLPIGLLLDRYPVEDEPDGEVLAPHHFYVGVLVASFGFLFVWPVYPTVGAVFTLGGLLVALDDAVSHTFGVWTPLDALWRHGLLRVVRRIENP
jgi:hypothetical protein